MQFKDSPWDRCLEKIDTLREWALAQVPQGQQQDAFLAALEAARQKFEELGLRKGDR